MTELELKLIISKLSKMSNEELVALLAQHMAAQKSKDGGASMQKTLERIKPLLNAEQRARLEEVLKSVGN